ncbi:MAG TPA: hypothetical protein VFZ78_08080, partial [Flavisolibacter sp.]
MKFPLLHSHFPKRSLLLFAGGLFALSVITSYYFRIQPSAEYHQRLLQQYIRDQEEDSEELLADSMLMRKLVLQSQSVEELEYVISKRYGLFLYAETLSETHEPLFWNNQKILPPPADFALRDTQYFQSFPNGYYLVSKKTLQLPGMSNNVIAHVMIPVQHKDIVSTGIPRREFAHDPEAINKVELSDTPTPYGIKSASGQTHFYIRRLAESSAATADILTVILRLIGLLFLLVYVHMAADNITRRSRVLYGVLFLAGILVLVRALMYAFPQLFALRQFELFDSRIYASNNVNRSLGDLLINSILTCWIVLFTWYSVGPLRRIPRFLRGKKKMIAGVAAVFILIFLTFQLANVVRSLVADSKISFNVTEFFTLNIYTIVGFIVLALISLAFYYFTRLLLHFIFAVFRNNPVYVYFIIGVIGLIFLTLRMGDQQVLFHIPVLLWLVLYTLLISQEQFIINSFRATVAGILFWIFVFSISLAVVILHANRENEIRVRKLIAEKYDELTD